MLTFFCPDCWSDSTEDSPVCPRCGAEIQSWKSKDFLEKLIIALGHTEPSTPIRAARILGELGGQRAVRALADALPESRDVFLTVEIIRALGRARAEGARPQLEAMLEHPSGWVRREAEAALSRLQAAQH
jgi:HEAT repeat protein